MHNQKRLKKLLALCLPLLIVLGVAGAISQGQFLKASDNESKLVTVSHEEKEVTGSFETDKEAVEITLTAKETGIYSIPYDEANYSIDFVAKDDYLTYYELAEEEIDIDTGMIYRSAPIIEEPEIAISEIEQPENIEANESIEESVEPQEETQEDLEATSPLIEPMPDSGVFKVRNSEEREKGVLYLKLKKNQSVALSIQQTVQKDQSVILSSAENTEQKQTLIHFKNKAEEVTSEKETTENESSKEEKNDSEIKVEAVEEKAAEENEEESTTEKVLIDPQAISKTDPFVVEAYVGRTTGVKPFDTINGPGYDTDENDEVVRTFDLAAYRVTMGIENTEEKYSSFQVRLDAELPNAWRKDESGQVRRTAEFENGLATLVDTGNGTKKSVLTARKNVIGAMTAQVFFTENIRTYGGVDKDEIDPHFTVTIETATLASTGETVKIDQVINRDVEPKLKNPCYISAKALVDVKLELTPMKKTTFEKATGTNDKPNSFITNVVSYVKLKPLPERADVTSIKGSTYPVGGVEYDIKQKIHFKSKLIEKDLDIGVETDPIEVIVYDGLTGTALTNKTFTDEFNSYSNVYQAISRQGVKAPVGYTNEIYPDDTQASTMKGIYNTGNPVVKNVNTNHTISVKNDNYAPVSIGKNKWYLGGGQMGSNDEPFSVAAMQVIVPYDYMVEQSGVDSSMTYSLSVDTIKYEGDYQKVSCEKEILWDKTWPGSISAHTAFLASNAQGLSTSTSYYYSFGDGVTTTRNKIWSSFYGSFTDPEASTSTVYARWNANSFQYDEAREIRAWYTSGTDPSFEKYSYGVGNNIPDVTFRSEASIENSYTWYDTVAEAKIHGDIAIVKSIRKVTAVDGYAHHAIRVPLIAIGNVGVKDNANNPNIALTNVFNKNSAGKETSKFPIDKTDKLERTPDYLATKYDESGKFITNHSPSSNYGDTLYIAGMTIRPTISTNKKTYAPDETVKWTVDGKVESGSDNKHKVQFSVTIPKETQYVFGTAKDHQGNPLPDPDPGDIVENEDGTWTLKWILDYTAKNSTYNPKIIFDTSIISSKLSFNNNVATLNGKVVAEVWLEDDESVKDTSVVKLRTSTTDFTVTNSGVIVIDKVVDKPHIESGNKIDPAKPSDMYPTDFTYTISFRNHSSESMYKVKVLDVLPRKGDGRGTDFNGTYLLTQLKQLPGSVPGTIYYTDIIGAATIDTDPNEIPLSAGWYQLGSDMTVLENAKAIVAVYSELPAGKDVSLSLTMRPTGQQAGDKYVNSTALNSNLNRHVRGVNSSVQVYGRDLSGVAWYDDSLDGLIGNKPDQSVPEDFAKDIPVKLYRTSLENPDYKNQLVKESLTGEEFIDPSGNSKIKTNENGEYIFKNLPEGEYVAEFIIDGEIHRVTKQLIGDDVTKNSKADPSNNKTPSYTQPKLNDLASVWGQADSINHVTDVNVGLIRPGTIKLFKYEAGTAIDGNKDGELSDPEKATGTPLKGAVFDLYQGHTGTGTKLGTATTDENGKLQFKDLFPGEYSLVETKAPIGFELLKTPIKVTITQGNQVIQLYQDNDVQTDLPFTGGDNPMIMLLLAAASLMTAGFIGMMLYYRQPKRRRHTR
ncbi:prealbumin-like fold domain-containing protein [Candidatus Enterococcus ferrettii]|uniref:SpaA-like prealbumin fold domain-containing protein n=1 Tax=Candidatus Enterococcus ferrettii TaxID=2815324 RepID=A0ABV0EMD5_9ENTE|nr:prealbumin-like fold domain-containing protein [Enterococcus sp. 665A]MBO1339745.1 hypothetical protein [Enterococcus sp. 665A]